MLLAEELAILWPVMLTERILTYSPQNFSVFDYNTLKNNETIKG